MPSPQKCDIHSPGFIGSFLYWIILRVSFLFKCSRFRTLYREIKAVFSYSSRLMPSLQKCDIHSPVLQQLGVFFMLDYIEGFISIQMFSI